MQPRISVIIPTYQCAEYLKQAVDSVLAQTYPQELVEIIVVNDGSSDSTEEVLKPYLSRIHYIYQQNRGEGAARNVGVSAARSDLVTFLDADDYWLPQRLQCMIEALGGRFDRLVVTDFLQEVRGSKADIPEYQKWNLGWVFELGPREQYKLALESNFIAWPLVARDILHSVGPFDESLHYGTDWDMWLRCVAANHQVVLAPIAGVVYRLYRPGSSTVRNDFAKALDRVRILERHRAYVSKRRWKTAVGLMHYVGLRESIEAGAYSSAIRHLFPLLLNPTYVGSRIRSRLSPDVDSHLSHRHVLQENRPA